MNIEPHTYRGADIFSTSYRGCEICGFGPGAYEHNTANVESYNSKKKFNAVVSISEPFSDRGEWINISIVTPDQKEHEIMLRKEDFVVGKYWIPAEYSVHPSCCEHPNGCPDGSRTQKFLEEVNNENN